jgi:hypothetical protein
MYLLDRQAFRGADTSKLPAFVAYWERFYRGAVPISRSNRNPIDYFTELNLSGDLTVQNLTQLGALNQFRRGEIDVTAFTDLACNVFSSGIVWQLFLFHVARPWEWPIADQHVFRAYAALFGAQTPRTIAEFQAYRVRFAELARFLTPNDADTTDLRATVRINKRLDNALMAYGQFLSVYDH